MLALAECIMPCDAQLTGDILNEDLHHITCDARDNSRPIRVCFQCYVLYALGNRALEAAHARLSAAKSHGCLAEGMFVVHRQHIRNLEHAHRRWGPTNAILALLVLARDPEGVL